MGIYLDAGSWQVNRRAAFSKKLHRSRTDLSTERSVRVAGINFLRVAECLKGIVISLVDADALKLLVSTVDKLPPVSTRVSEQTAARNLITQVRRNTNMCQRLRTGANYEEVF